MKCLLFSFLSLTVIQFGHSSDFEKLNSTKCNSPDTCVSIFECSELYGIYQKNNDATKDERETIRSAKCDFRGGAPYVCCTTCGKSVEYGADGKFDKRIIGGGRAKLGDWPWMAALYIRNQFSNVIRHVCGGSLIASQWVLTAAHCIPSQSDSVRLDHVRLGDLDINTTVVDGASPIEVKIQEIIRHPQFKMSPVNNDIALIRLIEPVSYTPHIRPICLHSGERYTWNETHYNMKYPYVMGWGMKENGSMTSHLMVARLGMVPYDECAWKYVNKSKKNPVIIKETMLCSAAPEKDSCQGDSGGPLTFQENGYWALGGIVSFGVGCAQEEYPGVYTKVAAFIDWINESTGLKF